MMKIRRILTKLHGVLKHAVLLPVYFYRRFVSPMKGTSTCRFTPTCSRYAIDAVTEWGVVCGTALAVWRVLRCNPFGKGGYDPVPPRPGRKNK